MEEQEREWLKPSQTAPYFTFVQYYECYFDHFPNYDPKIETLLDGGLFTEKEASVILRFHRLLCNYDPPKGDHFDLEAILKDPNWHKVCIAAHNTKRELGKILQASEEINRLLGTGSEDRNTK